MSTCAAVFTCLAARKTAAESFQSSRKIDDSKMSANRFTGGVPQFGGQTRIVHQAIDLRGEIDTVARIHHEKILPIVQV